MNERIKQLAEQAGLTWRVQPLHYTNTNNPIDFPVSANRDLEKFAELIVQECIAVMDITAKEAKEHHVYIDDVPTSTHQYKIKQHFGVKE